MKRLLLVAFASAVLLPMSAFAADLGPPVYRKSAPPPPPPPAYNWTGCYVGAGFGYGLWTQDHQEFDLSGDPESLTSTSGGKGWLGDAQVGCDYQFPAFGGNWVVGVFSDYDWANIHGAHDLSLETFPFVADEKLNSQWSVGGRLGWVPMDHLLLFVSGGYTQAHFDGYTVLSNSGDFGGLGAPAFSVDSRNRNGWFLGSGYEYVIPWFPNLTWKTEYRFSEFNSATDTIFDLTGTPAFQTTSTKWEQTVVTNLTWRFNWFGH